MHENTPRPLFTLVGEPFKDSVIGDGWYINVCVTPPYTSEYLPYTIAVPLPTNGEGKIYHIKRVREWTALGLHDAKSISDAMHQWFVKKTDGSSVGLGVIEPVAEKVEVLPERMKTALVEELQRHVKTLQETLDAIETLSRIFPCDTFSTVNDYSVSGRLEIAARHLQEARYAVNDVIFPVQDGKLFKGDNNVPF